MPAHTYTHEARRICVEEAQSVKASHLFFMDSDMMMPGDTLNKLLAHNKMIVGCSYNERRLPLVHTVKVKDENGLKSVASTDLPKHLFKCYALGMGCLLIDMRVFDTIEKPWFFFSSFSDGRMDYGEDVWFCEQAHKAGIDVWCDPTFQPRHIGEFAY